MTLLYPLFVKFYLSYCYVANTLKMNEAPRESLVGGQEASYYYRVSRDSYFEP